VGDKKKMRSFMSQLDDVAHRIPTIGGYAVESLDRIEKLMSLFPVLEFSEHAKLLAAERAIAKKAPFHGGKNSMSDAVLIETYGECVREKKNRGVRFAFVTHNKHDFSVPNGNQKMPHADIAPYFSKVKSLYFLSLAEALRRVEPSLVSDLMIMGSFEYESREMSELMEAEDLLVHQVWYNRHQVTIEKIEEGKIKLVNDYKGFSPGLMDAKFWKGARRSAKLVEKKYGLENLGPWSDFEWGMINGKLSALRWVMGFDWDLLHT